jgi:predicted DNA-binding mobile mystery protein A
MNKQKLILEQLDKKIIKFNKLTDIAIPPNGWIYSIRTAIRMSLRQLAERLNITTQSVKEIEGREQSGSVSIKVLRQAGEALNMKLVYGFIPQSGTLEKMIEDRAKELAKEIVLRTSNTMQLEDQENTEERIEKAIQEKTEEIIQKMPRYLWN